MWTRARWANRSTALCPQSATPPLCQQWWETNRKKIAARMCVCGNWFNENVNKPGRRQQNEKRKCFAFNWNTKVLVNNDDSASDCYINYSYALVAPGRIWKFTEWWSLHKVLLFARLLRLGARKCQRSNYGVPKQFNNSKWNPNVSTTLALLMLNHTFLLVGGEKAFALFLRLCSSCYLAMSISIRRK